MTSHHICVCETPNCQRQSFIRGRHLPNIRLKFEDKFIEGLLDTGAMVPLLHANLCAEIQKHKHANLTFTNRTLKAFGCNGSELQIENSVIGRLFFHQHDSPILAEFYILKNASQACIIPHPWLQALKAIIDYNIQSIQYELPQGNKSYILTADGHLKQFDPNHHINDHNDKHDHNDNADNDGDNDNDDEHDGNNDDDDEHSGNHHGDNSENHSLMSVPAQSSQSRNMASIKKIKEKIKLGPFLPAFWQIDKNLTASIRINNKKKPILTINNHSDSHQTVNISRLQLRKLRPNEKLLPIQINKWTVNHLSTEDIDIEIEKYQSTFSNQSKFLSNMTLDSPKIPFTIPTDIQGHPFTETTSPLTFFHVYLLHILGSNFKYMLKTEEELKEIIFQSGTHSHKRTHKMLVSLYKKAKIQEMYSQMSIYIACLVHRLFLDNQRKQYTIDHTPNSSQNNKLRKLKILTKNLVSQMKSVAALYFLNQKLINDFFQTTLQHPYFKQLVLPISLEETLTRLTVPRNTVSDDNNHNSHHDENRAQNCDDNNDRTHDDDHDSDDSDDHHIVNSIALKPPTTLPNKYSYQQYISEPSPKCEAQELNFQQYCETLNEQCNQISEQQKDQTHPCEFSANPQKIISAYTPATSKG